MVKVRYLRALNVLLLVNSHLVQYLLIPILIKMMKITICRIQGIWDIKYLL